MPDQDELLEAVGRRLLEQLEQRATSDTILKLAEAWAWLANQHVARPEVGRLFGEAELATRAVRMEHTAEELNALFRTMSVFQRLSVEQREALEAEQIARQQRLARPLRGAAVAVLVTARALP